MPSISRFQQSRSLQSAAVAQSALSILHDHDKLMRCQPLVGQIETLSSAPDCAKPDERSPEHHWFRQTEHVPFIPGIWKKKVVFENCFKDLTDTSVATRSTTPTSSIYSDTEPDIVEGGVESKVYAPGLEIKAVFKVVRRNPHHGKVTLRKREKYGDVDPTEGGWVIIEKTTMRCQNAMVKYMSVSQHRDAQRKMLDSIVHEARKRTYVAKPTDGQ